jgi:HSP20 family protein
MLTLWRPHRELLRWSREFDDALAWPAANSRFRPAVDIDESDDSYVLHVDLPGMKEEEIDITVQGDTLELSGKREESRSEEENGRTLRERCFGSFVRRFELGPHVEASNIEATYKDGVLSIVLPKREDAKARQIPVTAH